MDTPEISRVYRGVVFYADRNGAPKHYVSKVYNHPRPAKAACTIWKNDNSGITVFDTYVLVSPVKWDRL